MPEGPGLFEVARERIRTRHLAFRTEQAYLQWMRRYVKFHGGRHPRDMGPAEVEAFLTHLAVAAKVGASTQNQALQAPISPQQKPWRPCRLNVRVRARSRLSRYTSQL
jgi:hypothetical protein